MIILRYYWWLLVYTLMVFHKMKVGELFKDLIEWPTHVVNGLMKSKEDRKELILSGMGVIRHYWTFQDAALPPDFVVRKLLSIEQEARS